jgi:hypothetical protein
MRKMIFNPLCLTACSTAFNFLLCATFFSTFNEMISGHITQHKHTQSFAMVPQTKKLTVDAITHAPTQVVMLPYGGYQRKCQTREYQIVCRT